MDGVLVADKPAGYTSHDVVGKVKKILCAAKVGHLGTLDPMATGVLPLVVNKATKYASALEGGVKIYEARLRLGIETDTYDGEGRIVKVSETKGITAETATAVLKSFTGRIKQLPPMYSAVKIGGRPLYELARKGITIEREPREVEVYSIDVISVTLPDVDFRLVCSKGTYVRSICHDSGLLLRCGAHLLSLRRTQSGVFKAEEAVDISASKTALTGAIIPLETALKRVSAAVLPECCTVR